MKSSRGKTIRSGAREIIANVIQMCDDEAKNKDLHLKLSARSQRAAAYTGVSSKSIRNIRQEHLKRKLENPTKSLVSPGKKRQRLNVAHKIQDFDFQVIRREIEDFYIKKRIVSTAERLLAAIKEKIDFPYSSRSLSRLLYQKGFLWRRGQSGKKILMERAEIVSWRFRYLQAIKKFRSENKNIIYLDETWVDNDMTLKKCWQIEDLGIKGGVRSSSRLIVVHAGSIQGFIKNAGLVYKSATSTGDYHGQMNKQNFEKWMKEYLFPNILSGSVIVFDNAPYHSEQTNKVPSKYAPKSVMSTWLTKNKITHDPSQRKPELHGLITAHMAGLPKEKQYKVDEIIKQHGHIPLRLPPFMCELNPIELAWIDMKDYIRDTNTNGDLSVKELQKYTYEALESVTTEKWEEYVKRVIDVEDHYWETDELVENYLDEFVIRLGEESSDDNSSEEESDVEYVSSSFEEDFEDIAVSEPEASGSNCQ